MEKKSLLIYMPALNEEKSITNVLAHLPKEIEGIGRIDALVIDDGSMDRTADVARNAGAKVVSHHRNIGVGGAFHSAIQYALENCYDILVGIDADMQFDPDEIPMLVKHIVEDRAEMVIGNRFNAGRPEHMPAVKFWGNNQVASLINYVSRRKFSDVSCGFRAYSREALYRMNIFGEFTYTHETILSLVFQGMRVIECPIRVHYDPERKSRVAGSILRYAVQTIKIIFRVLLDYRPMRIFGGISGISMAFGMIFVLFLMGHYFITGSYSPYKSFGFIGLGFIIFGMLVLLVALVADMLNRLKRNQDRLLYEIKKMQYKA